MNAPVLLRSPYPDVEIPDTPLVPFVLQRVAVHPDKPAIVCGATGRQVTYGGLARAIRQAAAGLHARWLLVGSQTWHGSPGLASPAARQTPPIRQVVA